MSQQERISGAPGRLRGVTACRGMAYWGRAFQDCIRCSMGHLGEDQRWKKGGSKGVWEGNKHVTVKG